MQKISIWMLPVVELLANDKPLEPRHRDHPLTGDWKDHRDCHIGVEQAVVSLAAIALSENQIS
ncbi:type II toxin-antitoxin system mRNA interferase toxin, RelE/StbE family [Azotobacter beijerinckii]|uniref:type II toxin-antitoxin system mRNA interferase toxin, RelE/StbE family n=1 Tax=Azotobacter beijerinckii TaxID=170623 RepID=UPI002953CE15|nr:type II toxin-antitoxin system mRNA interferase toxin, RelE/StbE family [Azotobacter beijerinckii]MDV7211344.1 type II toxin-antitoxin system mRNA interferase toxin, RelE/StbE family [Azotobacter beijerinckii]